VDAEGAADAPSTGDPSFIHRWLFDGRWFQGDTLSSRSFLFEGEVMANKDKSGSKSSKTAASKSLKEKRQAKKEKAARASSSDVSPGK